MPKVGKRKTIRGMNEGGWTLAYRRVRKALTLINIDRSRLGSMGHMQKTMATLSGSSSSRRGPHIVELIVSITNDASKQPLDDLRMV